VCVLVVGHLDMSPTQRSLALLRKQGWLVGTVERYNPYSRTRHDLYDLFDLVAVRENEILFVQTTSASNVSSRIKKITNHPDTPFIRKCGAFLHIHGWGKKKGRWECRVVDVS
jgi:hypothetical protein